MTVAAVVLADSIAAAMTNADGLARVRRIVDTAWSGGALPIVVVTPDADRQVLTALAGATATLVEPGADDGRTVLRLQLGVDSAVELVAATRAVLVWPSVMCWVGPETVTSLIEAHGARPDALLEPTYGGITGWPKLLPLAQPDGVAALARLLDDPAATLDVAALSFAVLAIELGDPGVTRDGNTARSELPPYDGPQRPVHDHRHEWGASMDELAGEPSRSPVSGRD